MNNVLLLYESYEPTNAELFKMLSLAEERGAFYLKRSISSKVTADDISWCDVILSVRSTSAMEWRLARYAKQKGKYWILMLDDDFLSLDGKYGKDGQGYRKGRKIALRKILKDTDCLLAVNKLLAEKYTSIGNIRRYVLTNTAVDCKNMTRPGEGNEKTKLVFYVNDGTLTMFDLYIRPLIPKLCEKYRGKLALYFLGLKPDLKEYEDKIEIHYVPHMSFNKFLKHIANEHFDIGLAPLDEQGFSKYKYFNKYVEYTRSGIAGVYTDCTLYKQVVKSGKNGILCDNSSESWLNAVSLLIDNSQLRISIAENAQEYARENLSAEKVVDRLLHDLPELGEYTAPRSEISAARISLVKFCYWGFRMRGWCYTFYNCVRSGNAKALMWRIRQRVGRKE